MKILLLGRSGQSKEGGNLLHSLPAPAFSAHVSFLESEHYDIAYSNSAGLL